MTHIITWAYGCRVILNAISSTGESFGVNGVCSGLTHSSSKIWEKGEKQKRHLQLPLSPHRLAQLNIPWNTVLYKPAFSS